MQYSNKITMQELFQNRKLANILPQFYKRDGLKNVYSFQWVEEKITSYLKGVLRAKIVGEELIVRGKHREKIKEIRRLKTVIESMFNTMPSITKNIRKNTRLLLPIESVEEFKQVKTMEGKLQVMEWILENIKYNPNFQTKQKSTPLYIKEQKRWMKKVGIL